MNRNSLLAAILIGSTVFGSFSTMPFSLAQEESEIESTAPGSVYEGIPEIEPAPVYEDPDPSSRSKIYDPKLSDGSEETTSVPQTKSTARTSPDLVEVPSDTSAFNKPEQKVVKAIRTFEEFVSDPDINIPPELLSQSEGVIIIPDMVQAGLFFGARRGTGILSLRNEDGSWSNPAFVKMTGGSLGLQIGAKSSDLVLIFPKRSMVHEAFTGSYKLGGNVAGTAGSLGRTPVDSSQRYSKDKIYAYSRSSGLYGGVSLEGSELSFNSKLNEEFYGQSLTPRQIFANTYTDIPTIADSLSTLLSQAESGEFRLF
jgi:SH3 domain-containing YSC84-like protein 1